MARAVADAMHAAGLSPAGAESVRIDLDRTGTYRATLQGVSVGVSRAFVVALAEVLAPLGLPRYVIPRYVITPPANLRRAGRAWLSGKAEPNAVVYHAVLEQLGTNATRARTFARAWARWVSHGTALYTGSPEGAGILAAQRGEDPFAASTVLRFTWS